MVQFAVFGFEIGNERFVAGRGPRNTLDQLPGAIALALAVDVLRQPVQQGFEIAAADLGGEVGQGLAGGGEDLAP